MNRPKYKLGNMIEGKTESGAAVTGTVVAVVIAESGVSYTLHGGISVDETTVTGVWKKSQPRKAKTAKPAAKANGKAKETRATA